MADVIRAFTRRWVALRDGSRRTASAVSDGLGMALPADDRAVSPVFGYVLTLSVATLLVGGLLISAGGFIDEQQRDTGESELQVVGQQISADIAAADRLNRTAGADDVRVGRTLPQEVVGSHYTIEVVDGGGPTSPYLELRMDRPEVTVKVGIASKSAVKVGASADGGSIEIVMEGSGSDRKLVLQNGR